MRARWLIITVMRSGLFVLSLYGTGFISSSFSPASDRRSWSSNLTSRQTLDTPPTRATVEDPSEGRSEHRNGYSLYVGQVACVYALNVRLSYSRGVVVTRASKEPRDAIRSAALRIAKLDTVSPTQVRKDFPRSIFLLGRLVGLGRSTTQLRPVRSREKTWLLDDP